jgi:hypothetical protein
MSKFYGYAPFSGHFWTGKRNFWLEIGELFFRLVHLGVSGVSIQMPFAQLGAKLVYFMESAPRFKKIDIGEANK